MSVKPDILNENSSLNDSGYSNALDSTNSPRYRWYFVKEAFSPNLVEEAIEKSECKEDDLIIDPFCGSGTVPLVASIRGIRGIGIEVNPFLAFLSRAKLLQCRPTDIDKERDRVIEGVRSGKASSLEKFSTFSQASGVKKWLFNQEILRAFTGGWDTTCELDNPIRSLFQLALLGSAMDTCNATRDGKALRYRKDWKDIDYGSQDFIKALDERLNDIKADLVICPNDDNQSRIVTGDSRQILGGLKKKFKLCVTSPPYLNSFDYTDVYRPELFLGRFICSQQDLRALRLKTVRSHIQAKWKDPTRNDFGPRYTQSIELVGQRTELIWSKRIPTMIQAYFEDIRSVLKYLYNLAEVDANLWLVVSTSAYAGIEVPVDFIVADIGAKVGWKPQEIGVLRYLRTSSQHWKKWSGAEGEKPRLRESVVIFKA